ncbi:MAG: phosphate ABC transporter substrate-binding protein [Thiogranum sp.]|nr:phosphate ABC transporter substrate-binding protein [Thiogranum sp.]
MKKNVATFLALTVAGMLSQASQAELAVVVAPSVNVDSISLDQLERLYLDKSVSGLQGAKLTPVDHKQGSAQRQEFAQKVMGKTERELASYWSRVMFSGKGQPPRQYSSDAEVIEQITADPGKVGYIDGASVTEGTKVILRIP